MIQNERQLAVTREQLLGFEQALEDFGAADKGDLHPLLVKAQFDALVSMRDELRDSVAEYVARTSVPTIRFLNGMR